MMMMLRLWWVTLAFVAGLGLAVGAQAAETIKSAMSGAAESSHVFCDATGSATVIKKPCALRSLYVTIATAVSGFILVYDLAAAPVNGAVTPRECIYIAGPDTRSYDLGDTAVPYVNGLTVAFSTTGCFTQTLSATAFFSGRVQ